MLVKAVMLDPGIIVDATGMRNGWTKAALNCTQTCVVPMFSGTTGGLSTVSTSSEGEEEEKEEMRKKKEKKKTKSEGGGGGGRGGGGGGGGGGEEEYVE